MLSPIEILKNRKAQVCAGGAIAEGWPRKKGTGTFTPAPIPMPVTTEIVLNGEVAISIGSDNTPLVALGVRVDGRPDLQGEKFFINPLAIRLK